mgnify:CR=1 FL=1
MTSSCVPCTLLYVWILFLCVAVAQATPRLSISLDGEWRIAEGRAAERIPLTFDHTVPVPGLVNLAVPAFKDVDQFISRENMARRITYKLVPEDWLQKYWVGKSDQERDYFWYRKTFRAPKERAVARVERAVRQHLARRTGASETTSVAALLDDLADRGVPPALREELRLLLSQVEFLRFAPQLGDYADEIARLREKARDVLGRVRGARPT